MKTGTVLILLSVAVLALGAVIAATATNSHHTAGTSGTHSSGSHSLNPAHIWLSFRGDHSGNVTSGGRYHDGCVDLNPPSQTLDRCYSAHGGDYAIDVGSTGTSYISLDYAGYADPIPPRTLTPNHNANMDVYLRLVQTGNYRNDPVGRPACNWQKWELKIVYWATQDPTQIKSAVVGYLWFAHLNFSYSTVGTFIYPNASRPQDGGTGTVYYVSPTSIGSVYPGGDTVNPKCSDGAHSHMEWYSNHSWGAPYEWHSTLGPDYFYDYHVHGGGGVEPAFSSASTMNTSRVVGFVGGGTTSPAMWENPYHAGY